MYLVINADDLGLHPAVQRAVETCAEAGVVTSATLLANGPYVDSACQTRGVGLGVHLNVLRGRPLCDPREVPTLLGEKGLFLGRYTKLFWRYLKGDLACEEVEREWRRQIESLLERGVRPTHLDSEKHVHCWPRLMPIAQTLAKRYGVRWVRRTVEITRWTCWTAGGLRARLLRAWSRSHRPVPGVAWPDAVWGVALAGDAIGPAKLVACLRRLRGARVVEMICHPGDPRPNDPPLAPEFGPLRVRRRWATEFRALTSQPWRSALESAGITLAHYGQASPPETGSAERET